MVDPDEYSMFRTSTIMPRVGPTHLRHSAQETGTRPGLRLCFVSPPAAPAVLEVGSSGLSVVRTGAITLSAVTVLL